MTSTTRLIDPNTARFDGINFANSQWRKLIQTYKDKYKGA